MHLHYSFKKCDTSHFIRSKNVIFFLYILVKQGGSIMLTPWTHICHKNL